MELTKISGPEFVERILKGERDFSGMNLDNFDAKKYSELRKYLPQNIKRASPLIFIRSSLSNVNFSGLYLPYTIAVDADFSYANLSGSLLDHSNFSRAILSNADLSNCSAEWTKFFNANITEANFRKCKKRESQGLENSVGFRTIHIF